MTRENSGTLYNLAHSYVYAEFNPVVGGSQVSTILDPSPIDVTEPNTTVTLPSLKLPDNYYTARINQTNKVVKDKNQLELVAKVAGYFLGLIFETVDGQSKNDCVGSITGAIASELITVVIGSPNLSAKELLIKLAETAKTGIVTVITSGPCVKYLLSKKMAGKIMLNQVNVYTKIITGINLAKGAIDILPYIAAVGSPVDLAQNVQLYESAVKEGWLSVGKEGTLKTTYAPGEKIYPDLKLIPNSQYGELLKSGFKVNWKAATGNGSVNLAQSSTDNNGKATVEWTLPKDKSGLVTLQAEIKDKEGDHLQGSPLEFTVTVNDSIAYYTALLTGKWTLIIPGSLEKQFFVFNSDKSLLQTGGVDSKGATYNSYECTSKNSTWSVFKGSKGYSVQLNKPYESRYYYAYIRANNVGNLIFYNAFNTCTSCTPPVKCW